MDQTAVPSGLLACLLLIRFAGRRHARSKRLLVIGDVGKYQMPTVILHRPPIHIDHSRQACGLEQSRREVQHVFDHRFCFDIDDAPTPTFPRFTIMNEFPTEIGGYFVARATLTGPIVIDVKTIKELIESEREAFEDRDELAERMIESDRVHGFSILGIYKSYEEATAALDWVRAWRQGS